MFQKEQNASSNKGTEVALAVPFRLSAATGPRFKALNMTADPKYALMPSFYGLRTNFKIKYSTNEGDGLTPPSRAVARVSRPHCGLRSA